MKKNIPSACQVYTLKVILFLAFSVFAVSQALAGLPQLVTDNGMSLEISRDGRALLFKNGERQFPGSGSHLVTLRDMSRAGDVIAPDLLVNPGFESGIRGWTITDHDNTALSLSGSTFRSGTHALEIRVDGFPSSPLATVSSSHVTVTPGRRYRISGWFKSRRGYVQGVSGTPPIRQEQMWQGKIKPAGLYISWFNATGKMLDTEAHLVAPLHWNAHEWRRIGGEVRAPHNAATAVVAIRASLYDDCLWVDDLAVIKSPEADVPLYGTVEERDGGLVQHVETEDGLIIEAAYEAHTDFISIEISLDSSGLEKNSAFELAWGIPLDLFSGTQSEKWRWWDDAHHSREIRQGPLALTLPEKPFNEALSWQYEHVVSGVWDGWMPVSLYPWSVVENGECGIALAVSIGSPSLVKLAYDQENRRLEARCHVGTDPSQKHGNIKVMKLELYATDPAWGFRSAIDRYIKRHTAWFVPSRPMYFYNDYTRDSYTTPDKARQVAADDALGIFSAQYVVAESQVDIAPAHDPVPDYEQAVRVTRESPGGEIVMESIAQGTNSDWQIKHIGEFEWNMGKWSAVWYTNSDPDIPDGWGHSLWTRSIEPAINATQEAEAVLDGIMMDNYLTAPGIDLDERHIRLADLPLAYDTATFRPGVHNASSMYEFFTWLRERFHETGRDDMAVTVNFWGLATPNGTAPLIDAFGGEGRSRSAPDTNWNPAVLDYRRAIAGRKPMSFSNGDSGMSLEDVESFINLALFYSITPHKKDDARGWPAGSDNMLASARDLLHVFNSSSWEPVTHASSDNTDVWIERYGSRLSPCDDIYFTVHNFSNETVDTVITIDSAIMEGFPLSSLEVREIRSGMLPETGLSGGELEVHLSMQADDTMILRLSASPLEASDDAPEIKITPASGTFVPGIGIDFSFTVSDPQGLDDIEFFSFIFCGEDITESMLEGLAGYLTDLTENSATVLVPGMVLPEGTWPIRIIVRDRAGHMACARVEYKISAPAFPRLAANLFFSIPENMAAAQALSMFENVTIPALYSSGVDGGYDLGRRTGYGSYSDKEYDFSSPGTVDQKIIHEAKRLNPLLRVEAHRGLSMIEANWFRYGANCPQRWFADNLSPRWFAYTPLVRLQKAVTTPSELVFWFSPGDIAPWREWGVQGGRAKGLELWTTENAYEWTYLSFFDNSAGGGRGTVEIMAIQDIDWRTGKVTVAVRDAGNSDYKRAIYGRPQKYPLGSRAGLVPASSVNAGSPEFLMNRYCADISVQGCEETAVEGMGWMDAAAEYVRDFLLPSRYPVDGSDMPVWLVDGIVMDADCELWQPYNFPLGNNGSDFHLDMDMDGNVDSIQDINSRLPDIYEKYAEIIKNAAADIGRDFHVIVNGHMSRLPAPHHNGRRFEDFNGGFQEEYYGALEQYISLFVPGNLDAPLIALVNERDRSSKWELNFTQHRHIMAITLMEDGFYCHTGDHSTRLAELMEGYQGRQPEDWFDEFSVDANGYSSKHELYSGSWRGEYIGWLGRALGAFYEIPGSPGIYRRDFEHGSAIYSATGGQVHFDPPLRRICGADPGNDGSVVTELTMEPKSGIILRKDENSGGCPAH